ncbi:salivary glue protein Sgs-3 [Pygocentrus nattereri]|uniref:salivary glue protein Sgs-3 n=1 Tax=Pygocentrus nattereri TaxID=42514 RepID=UPI0018918695|nr:salivary glue protein Sgs-3 [Pygocentrus nattereri]
MGSSSCSKGFLLFLLLQMSLPSCVRGETSTVSSDPTSSVMTEINTATDVPTSITTLSTQTSTFTSPNTVSTMSMTNTTLNVTMTNNVTITTNGTALSTDSNSTNTSNLYCRIFTCNHTTCHHTFKNTNATLCPASDKYCELRIYDTMRYSTNCAANCSTFCTNASQINCSVDCCSSETCLYATITNLLNVTMMSMTSTTQSTTTTTKATTTVTTTAPTNGKKCHKISCNGDTCYQGNTNVVLCSPTQNYCMLKKATSGTVVTWTGGCSEDCSKETACSSATSTCFLECCNATTTASCLKLTGAVNMPSSATRGLFSPMLLMACSLFLWIISMDSSA